MRSSCILALDMPLTRCPGRLGTFSEAPRRVNSQPRAPTNEPIPAEALLEPEHNRASDARGAAQASSTQRKPMCDVEVSTASACRAAGRYRKQ
jgi:hypothetical protein